MIKGASLIFFKSFIYVSSCQFYVNINENDYFAIIEMAVVTIKLSVIVKENIAILYLYFYVCAFISEGLVAGCQR